MQEDDRHLSKLVLTDRHLSDSWCQRTALPSFVIIPQKLRNDEDRLQGQRHHYEHHTG